MNYTVNEVMQFVREEDVKFIRLAFCDVFGRQKNISIQPRELERAFDTGIAIDASSIAGFGDEAHSDLFLRPEPATLSVLPWRPEHGRVVRMFCDILTPDGAPFISDTRRLLKDAVADARKCGCEFTFGIEPEFYLFKLDENGNPTSEPYDTAGYMDIAPEDKGENIRREICLTLEQMGIFPESSHHEGGPGQNEIDFRYSDPVSAADNALTFMTVVKTIAHRNGICADFSPKPLSNQPGNGLHVNFSVKSALEHAVAGLMEYICDITLFLNPTKSSYERLGASKAPGYVSWSNENRSQLIRVPAAFGEYRRVELRSPDAGANPYIALALIIYACLNGIRNKLTPPAKADINLFSAPSNVLNRFRKLPATLDMAKAAARASDFVREHLPKPIISAYLN